MLWSGKIILPLCREIWRRRVNARLQALRSWFVRIGHHLRRGGAAYGVLLISLLLTLLASYYVRHNVAAQNRLRFDETTQATQEAIERRTKAYLDAMLGARGLFYAEYVTPESRETFARRAREEGLPELRPDLDPGGKRSVYFPVTYVGPLSEVNKNMLNYDLYADPAHRAAMDRARDTGEPRATKMVYVLTETSPNSSADFVLHTGFVVYLPVYMEGELQGTLAERRRALQGYIVGSFVSDELLDGISSGSFNPAIDFEVYDGEDIESSPPLYDRDGIKRAGEQGNVSLFSKKSHVEVAGHEWGLYFATLPRFEEGAESSLPTLVVVSGVGVSLLLFGITWMLVRSRIRAERASRDLEEANRKVEALYHSVEQELRVARGIQHALLPKDLPELEGWEIAHHYRPAREVGGDFYDFLRLEDGRVGFVIGDVSGKGIAAALVMANTQSVLRAVVHRGSVAPEQVLVEANEILCAYIPPTNMFVTCFYAILEPESGRLRYANAGHDLPYERHDGRVDKLRARGMPLGLMPGMLYEEKEAVLAAGDDLLFYSDGLIEAHGPTGEMFGFSRLQDLVRTHCSGDSSLIGFLLSELARFAGEGWEQEDDITLVTLERSEEL